MVELVELHASRLIIIAAERVLRQVKATPLATVSSRRYTLGAWRCAMLSGKLIRLIETHEEEIADRILGDIRQNVHLVHIRKIPEPELRVRGRDILKNLGHWLASTNEDDLAHEYETVGKSRFNESVPLHESIRALFTIKYKMLEFVDEQRPDPDVLSLYAEEELERRVDRFFDHLIIHMSHGYETAWRHHTLATHA